MPCLDEAETLATCIANAPAFSPVAAFGARCWSPIMAAPMARRQLAKAGGARVVDIAERGYGSALRGGIRAARGRYVIMGDSDDSYDFSDLGPFVEKLREGHQLVMGNRFQGGIRPGRNAAPAPLFRQPDPDNNRSPLLLAARAAIFIAGCAVSSAVQFSRSICRLLAWNSRSKWSSRPRTISCGSRKFRPRCRPMAGVVRPI